MGADRRVVEMRGQLELQPCSAAESTIAAEFKSEERRCSAVECDEHADGHLSDRQG